MINILDCVGCVVILYALNMIIPQKFTVPLSAVYILNIIGAG